MTVTSLLTQAEDIKKDDYCVLGLATCFLKEDGEFHQVQIVEPIPSAALEAILKGIPTSYQLACAKLVKDIIQDDQVQIPPEFPESAQIGDDFLERMIATIRTYKSRPTAQAYIPLDTVRDDFNYSLERKRVLNTVNIVRNEDNVKQHPHTHKQL
ncbi:hypothetical protein [Gloeocapsa sp. PCC 73106]|uniref:hypothetical protein n=1 Tax=Gloeocapsa sp. PCC 73106 TaxID=102232 RepID=UPI0002ABFED1|nr:hypothetical protein [Gloeocapsa sp. PCC 73106]ELR97294.1 hypothetical protein GLO73106DRAFT_00011020 [Gloeocapsa sp. PCC 73106]